MKPIQFVNDFDMHDSLIDSISVEEDGKTVRMVIDFAFWMQKDYKEGSPETGPLEVCFTDVDEYECPNQLNLEEISILKTSVNNGKVLFSLLNDVTDEYYEIRITAGDIIVEKK